MGLASGLLSLWTNIHDTMSGVGVLSAAPPAVMQTAQPIITLAVTVLQAYPGPGGPAEGAQPSSLQSRTEFAAAGAANMTAAAVAARAAAGDRAGSSSTLQSAMAAASAAAAARPAGSADSVPMEELSCAWVYRTQCLVQVVHVAEAFTEAVTEEVWSRAVGSPVAAVKPDTPARILELLQDQHVKFLVAFDLLVSTASLHQHRAGAHCLNPSLFPISNRRSRARERRQQRQTAPVQQQQQEHAQSSAQQQEPEVEPWHEKLEQVMGMPGCMRQLLSHTRGRIDGLHSVAAMMCCLGASIAAQGSSTLGPHSQRVVSHVTR